MCRFRLIPRGRRSPMRGIRRRTKRPVNNARPTALRAVTTKLRPGYLRKNGVPYSARTVLTEYFDRFDLPGGDAILLVTSEVVDPEYLAQPFWTSTHFKKQNDASGWKPTPCAAQ